MEDRVRLIVGQVMGVPFDQVSVDASPDTLAAWDSVRHMNLVLALEEEFGVEFTPDQTATIVSVRAIVEVLRALTEPIK
jgi:acyl carrier protein